MISYKIAIVKRYIGKWIVGVKENETADTRWLAQHFNTKTDALARFKCIYAPIGTKKIERVKVLTNYEIYEVR